MQPQRPRCKAPPRNDLRRKGLSNCVAPSGLANQLLDRPPAHGLRERSVACGEIGMPTHAPRHAQSDNLPFELSAATSARMRGIGVSTISRSASRKRLAFICSLKVAFARPK